MSDQEIQSDGTEKSTNTADRPYPIISSYGLLWEREKVDWTKTGKARAMNGSAFVRISGGPKKTIQFNDRQQDGIIVNFAEQIGVYLLYDDKKLVYVGRATGKTSCLFNRLSEHATQNDKQGFWNKFSWFGFCPVDKSNQKIIRTALPEYSGELIVCVMEGILIATAAYPFNGQVGDFGGDAKKYGTWADYRYMQASEITI